MNGSWMSLLWFGAIVALIPAALWLLKRSGYAGTRGAGAGLQLDASLALGPQQRVVTLAVGEGEQRRWLVLGVTPQQITPLHVFDSAPVATAGGSSSVPGSAGRSGFPDLLAQWARRPGAPAAGAPQPCAPRRGSRGAHSERRGADTRGDECSDAVIEARIRREIAARSRREPPATTVPADLPGVAPVSGGRDGV